MIDLSHTVEKYLILCLGVPLSVIENGLVSICVDETLKDSSGHRGDKTSGEKGQAPMSSFDETHEQLGTC